MKQQIETLTSVADAILRAQTSFRNGQMDDYRPLAASKIEGERSDSMSSWGPANKK
jgi:hypothetical protein